MSTPQSKPRRGRPPKKELAKNSKGGRGKVGRPKGDAAIINEYRSRMLTSPKSEKVLETIFDAALDNEHKHQSAAWKLIMDRIAPVGSFDRALTGGQGAQISINISGLDSPKVDTEQPVDVEFEEITDARQEESTS